MPKRLLTRAIQSAAKRLIVKDRAQAGYGGRHMPDAQTVLDAGRLAEKTYGALDALGAQGEEVMILGRKGSNLSKWGLNYSHCGLCLRGAVAPVRQMTSSPGEWKVVHLLNRSDGPDGILFEEGLTNFYSDNLFQFDACVITLPKPWQTMIKAHLEQFVRHVFCPQYSYTSHPWSTSTMNCNQFVLEVLALAAMRSENASEFVTDHRPAGQEPRVQHHRVSDVVARDQEGAALPQHQPHGRIAAQSWLRERGYAGSPIRVPLVQQWLGPLISRSINFDDQPEDHRHAQRLQTVTVDSITRWLCTHASTLAPSWEPKIAHLRL